ncbi:hypothetical protein CHS0354_038823 [Potamilus streckersoni]|uniref:G-protein coupled receptors family 1 profile domain-containing protein n=1 Tax=Potamilus streckersoni TaxID=2493646 RepID=A0AAE0THP7_9BIVA|nr:hypothetical protein CHS0354_038823 [Potamilus streckersoni]
MDAATNPNTHMLVKTVLLGGIGFVCIIGNSIALITLCVYQSLRIPIYIIIGGLALADIISSLMNIPEEIIIHADKGEIKAKTWCTVYGFLSNSCQYIIAFHLVVLGVFRGILLTDRAHHGPSCIHAIITSVILWGVSLLANIPMIKASSREPVSHRCVFDAHDAAEEEKYLLLSGAFSYFLPLVLIIIIYAFTVYMSKRFFEDSYSRRERRMSKMISRLIVTFALCRLPSEMVTLLWFYKMKDKDLESVLKDREKFQVWTHVREYLSILALLDQALRPVIYATMSRDFGTVFDRIINCTCRNEEDEDPHTRRQSNVQELYQSPPMQAEVQDGEETECL